MNHFPILVGKYWTLIMTLLLMASEYSSRRERTHYYYLRGLNDLKIKLYSSPFFSVVGLLKRRAIKTGSL